ncbi:hypothetical protein [Zoogloea sp. LCSB751]|uniref:hypothetical protein n=1 Tax=Zoogloea sp. LCSB751 TaxID=1965277 RepID=UPI0011170AEF|nr:hypothetical protein [Zoogloea sp. LCSB751]
MTDMGHRTTLSAGIRNSVRDLYKQRAHKNENIWLIYSLKTDRDWLLTSDRELVLCLGYLESNPNIEHYEINPEISKDRSYRIPRAVTASARTYAGEVEWYFVMSDSVGDAVITETADASMEHPSRPKCNFITTADLKSKATLAVRWLNILSFGAELRNLVGSPKLAAHESATMSAVTAIRHGTIRSLLNDLHMFDEMLILGLIVKFACKGKVVLALEKRCFGNHTEWILNG